MNKSAHVKFLVIFLAMLMLLTACTGDNPSQSSSDPSSNPGSDSGGSGESAREPVELVWYTPVNAIQAGKDDVLQAVNDYTKEKLNATVDIHFYTSAEYNQAVSTMVSAGTYMDMVFTGATFVKFSDYAARNAFAPLEDYIDTYLSQTKAQLPAGAWEAFSHDGHIYAIPPMKDLASNYDFLLNQNMADDLGLTFPEKFDTFADLVPFFYEAKEKRDAKYPEKADQPIIGGLSCTVAAWHYIEGLVGGAPKPLAAVNIPGLNGFEGMGEGETVFCPFYTDEYREMMKIKRKAVVDGVLPFDGANFDPDKVLWQAGDLLGVTSQGYVFVEEDMYAPYFKTTLFMQEHSTMTTSYVQTGGQAISAKSDNIERALEFLELVNTDSYLATTLRFGVEGKGWTDKDNDGVFEDGPLNADTQARNWYNWYGWHFGSIIVSKYPQGYPANFGQLIKDFNDASNQESNLGFNVDPTPITNEIAACTNVVEEYHAVLEAGQSDDVDGLVDEFIAKLKANGSDKIVEEVQRQLTEWRTSVGKPTK